MGKISPVSHIILIIVFLVAGWHVIRCFGTQHVNAASGCIAAERNILLKFKASFSDSYDRLSSWNGTRVDCCAWPGVKCDTIKGHVISLDLKNVKYEPNSFVNMLSSANLNSSIMGLKYLSFLDLSGNNFQLGSIPAFLGSMNQLQHLNLSSANFSGVVPHQLGNLLRLSVLDLSFNGHYYSLIVDDFTWVSRLSSLTHLDMSSLDLTLTKDLLKVLNMLYKINNLRLHYCGLKNHNLQHTCSTNSSTPHIQYLDLSGNSFDGELPCFLENMSSLRELDLSSNYYSSCSQLHLTKLTNIVHLNLSSNSFQCNVDRISEFFPHNCNLELFDLGQNSFYGDISKIFILNSSICLNEKLATLILTRNKFSGQLPEEVGNFRKLKYLDLGDNLISGPIPSSISNLSSLTKLSLSKNTFNCSIPSSFGNLTALKTLVLDNNQLSGEIPISFGQLKNLEILNVADNYFSGTLTEAHFATLSMLQKLFVGNNQIKVRVKSDWTPPFQLRYLDMKSCEVIGGQFPNWLHTQRELRTLRMSHSSISGPLPDWLRFTSLTSLDLSNNRIEGSLPHSLREMTLLELLDLSNNRIKGPLADSLRQMTSLKSLYLSNNHIQGSLPDSLCEMISLKVLELSENRISGEIPECWSNLSNLTILGLSSNQLSGVIPDSIAGAYSLECLRLGNNSFTGEVPSSLRNCTGLRILDIGQNAISGRLPKWIGSDLHNLEVLNLRNNVIYDTIPDEVCQLSKLQILVVSNNKLSGNIPRCFGNFLNMVTNDSSSEFLTRYSMQEVMKGAQYPYSKFLRFLVDMDLSNNDLVGEIPSELTRLGALLSLNLSHNHLKGLIPGRIGDMESLVSLDLSKNNLCGKIPESLSKVYGLGFLSLSHNNLEGEIPLVGNLNEFDPSSFYDNPCLCGYPLPNKCLSYTTKSTCDAVLTQTEEEEEDTIWFYRLLIIGIVMGFSGVIGVLVLKRDWRNVYFKFVDDIRVRIFGR